MVLFDKSHYLHCFCVKIEIYNILIVKAFIDLRGEYICEYIRMVLFYFYLINSIY